MEEEQEAPLEQSNAQAEPIPLRSYALNIAFNLATHPTADHFGMTLIETAREIYLFASGKDPVIDCDIYAGENVIDFMAAKAKRELELLENENEGDDPVDCDNDN